MLFLQLDICRVLTEPGDKLVFNSPFWTQSPPYLLRVKNFGPKKIVWWLKTNQPYRFNISKGTGVLEVGKSTDIYITCGAFDYKKENTERDRISLEWTCLPDDSTVTRLTKDILMRTGLTQRKNLPVRYNP